MILFFRKTAILLNQMIAHHHTYLTEFKNIISLAWPLMMTHFLRFINPSLSIMICGHLSREELDAASLANTVINVLGLSIDMGFSTASETLFCQTFGSKKRKLIGLLLQRAILIMTMIYLVLACVHINIESFLLLLGQDPLISSLAAEYILYFLPGLFFDFMFMTLSRYLESQNHVKPMVIAACAGTLCTFFAQFFFVLNFSLGLRASAGFLSISFGVMLLCEIMYIIYYGLHLETWDRFDVVGALDDWGIFFKLGIPGVLMIALEEWCLELSTFVAGAMGDEILGAQAITFQVQSILYMIPLGISNAVNVRVGQGLGAFNAEAARHTYQTALIAIVGIVLVTVIPVIALKYRIPFLFTSDSEIAAIATSLFPMLIIFQFCEGLAGVSEAVLLACGRQILGACLIFLCYYTIGLPLGFYLTYKLSYGIIGMWIGLSIGFATTALAYMYFALKTDWTEESRKALNNVQQRYEIHDDRRLSIKQPHEVIEACFKNANLSLEKPGVAFEIENIKSSPVTEFRGRKMTVLLQITAFLFVISILVTSFVYRIYVKEPHWRQFCTLISHNSTALLPTYCNLDHSFTYP